MGEEGKDDEEYKGESNVTIAVRECLKQIKQALRCEQKEAMMHTIRMSIRMFQTQNVSLTKTKELLRAS